MRATTTQRLRPVPIRWGGARAGAGRKKTSVFVPHAPRPPIERRRVPVKVVIKLRRGHERLASRPMLGVLERAAGRARRFGLRVLQFEARARRLTLVCEFADRRQLERSLKSLNTTLAIALKRRWEARHRRPHRGPVLLDRFELERLDRPELVRAALRGLLVRERRVGSHAPRFFARSDATTSAGAFTRWRELLREDHARFRPPAPPRTERWRRLLASPRFRLSREGWFADASVDFTSERRA